MIERIIEISVRYRHVVVLTALFLTIGAWYSLRNVPMDALPDLSDTQVIVYSKWNKSPDIIEDQVTYPLIKALQGAPHVKTIRGISDYGYSFVYVIFEDGTDLYEARSRVLEYLSSIRTQLPEGVVTEMGPDATSLGWIFQYALVDDTGQHDVADLRSYQDWNLRFDLQSVEGVAEVASFGGHRKEYQVQVDPSALLAYDIPLTRVISALRKSNNETGGRMIEMGGREYMVRVRGYLKSIQDIRETPVGLDAKTGTPVTVRQIARVQEGPEFRRGAADFNGQGDTPGGIVIMRHGANAMAVIERVKDRIEQVRPGLPDGVRLEVTYDRSDLIKRAISTLKHTLTEEIIIVSILILVFLWHVPSSLVAIITIPVSVFLAFIPFYLMGMTANIMSLAGIAISVGVLVDGAIIEVENAYRKIELWIRNGKQEDFYQVRLQAMKEVAPSVFFSLLVIAVAFFPVFTLVDQEGRLFRPLAWSKNLTMAIAAILAVTLDPALRMMFSRVDPFQWKNKTLSKIATTLFVGKYYPEEKHPISRFLFRVYEPACRSALKRPRLFIGGSVLLMGVTIPAYMSLDSEFMPPLNEGTVLYMPTTIPGISMNEASRMLQVQDRILKSFPEVASVHGKVGRADTATDPAPPGMAETVVVLKPESEWRRVDRWYSDLPESTHFLFRPFTDDRITWDELMSKMDEKLQIPGWTNAFTMPIQARLDMLTTGIRTPIGIKIMGEDLKVIERLSIDIEEILKQDPDARSVYGERVVGGYYLDYHLNRRAIARYGLTVEEAQDMIASAVGGNIVTTTIEGRERYPVSVRYAREFRDDLSDLRRVLVPLSSGAHIPVGQIAHITRKQGPAMIRDENGKLTGYVYIDIGEADPGGFVKRARESVRENLLLPPGYTVLWTGQYENMKRVYQRLTYILPITIFLIFLLIYMNTGSWIKTGIILLAVPFSLIGAVWLLFVLDYNVSIAVWVGMIALLGLDAEMATFMLLYLDLSYTRAKEEGRLNSIAQLDAAVIEGAVHRIRPKIMTVASGFLGLLPILWSDGTGADVMKRIAAPMVGGLITSFFLELLIYPVLFRLWKQREL